MAKRRTTPPLWLLAPLWAALAMVAAAPPLHAQAPSAAPTAAPTASASAAASAAPSVSASASVAATPPPAPEDLELADLRRRTTQIRALLDGSLEDDIDPKALFDIDLDDPRLLAVEIERLRRVLAEAEGEGETDPDAGPDDAGAGNAGPDAGASGDGADAGASGGGAEAGEGGGAEAAEGGGAAATDPDPVLLEARLELDRARLAFYELSKKQRDALFVAHEEQRALSLIHI